MNPLNKIRKNLKELNVAFESIKSDETMIKGCCLMRDGGWQAVPRRVGVADVANTMPTVVLEASGVGEPVKDTPVAQDAPKAVETPVPAPVVLTPVSDHEVEMDGAIEEEVVPVEMVGGWPVVAEIKVMGLAPNRRLLKATLGDKIVSVERKGGWTAKAYQAKLIRAGSSPLYRIVA